MGLLHLIVIISVAGNLSDATAVGKVFIGSGPEDTTPEYSYNENYLPGSIPIYILLFNSTTGQNISDYDSAIDVACELRPGVAGSSDAKFQPVRISKPNHPYPVAKNVNFNTLVPGIPANLHCWGESTPDPEFGYAQFTKETSVSEARIFRVRKRGMVDVLESLTKVDNVVVGQKAEGSFMIQLSETVEEYDVNIYCKQNATGTDAADAMDITFTSPLQVTVGHDRVLMDLEASKGSATVIGCEGQSTLTGRQFIRATSPGSASTFLMAQKSVRLFPDGSSLQTTFINVFLVIEAPPQQDLMFCCAAKMVYSLEEAREYINNPLCDICDTAATRPPPLGPSSSTSTSTTPSTGSSTTPTIRPTPSPENITAAWSVQPSRVDFLPEPEIFKTLSLSRNIPSQQPLQELVAVKCCTPAEIISNPKYSKQTGMVITANLLPNRQLNWTMATTEEDREIEREILNPGYVEVSPCPCDITHNACDVDCCCDEECSEADKETFSCIPGIEGGFGKNEEARALCSSDYFKKRDWFPFLCVQMENSGFLGFYQFPEPALRTDPDYSTKAMEFENDYSYRKAEEDSSPMQTYKDGSTVRTGLRKFQDTSADYHTGENLHLTLPRRSWSGQCVWTAPVRHLLNDQDTCVHKMTDNLCSEKSMLNALHYAQSSYWSDPSQKGPLVLKQIGLPVTITDTLTNYLCAGGSDSHYLSRYVGSTNRIQDHIPEDDVIMFDVDFNETDCRFDDITHAYLCGNTTIGGEAPPVDYPSRCMWDDGSTKPPAPELDNDTNMCMNAVVDVLYNFTWSGTDILYLNATLILADIPMEVEKTDPTGTVNVTSVLTQGFEIQYVHSEGNVSQVEPDPTPDENTISLPIGNGDYARSGYLGYEIGRPVISGISVYQNTENDTTFDPTYIDTNDSSRLTLWQPDTSGLCFGAGRRPVLFQQNAMSSCILRLNLEELQNCDHLRGLVLNRQDFIMPANYISLGGDPDRANITEHWREIFRSDISEYIDNRTDDDLLTTEAVSPDTTTPLATTTLSQDMSTEFTFLNISHRYLDELEGICAHIPGGVHVDILYAEVGQANYVPVHQIVAAKIRYTLSTWQLYCSSADGPACHSSDTWRQRALTGGLVQTFTISSSVNFIKVPGNTPPAKTRYHVENDASLWFCAHDACWEELFYPWLKSFRGNTHGYTMAWGLATLIFALGFFIITRPWW